MAVDSNDSKIWKKTTVEEMDAIDKNETWDHAWDLVEFPIRRKPMGGK